MANINDSVTSVLNKAIDADPLKFVIVFLMGWSIYNGRALFNFISKKIEALENKIDGFSTLSQANVDKTRSMLDQHLKELASFQDKLREDTHNAREDILKTKYELLQQVEVTKTQCAEVKAMVAEYGSENSMVVKSVAEYKTRIENLERNINQFLEVLKKRKESGA